MRKPEINTRSTSIVDPTRAMGFLCFVTTATIVCVVFSDAVNDATMVPASVFCPWARILHQFDIINESKCAIALITATYLSILYLAGEFGKVRVYVFALCLHGIAVYRALESIPVGGLDANLMIWGMIVALPLSIFYYSIDIYWLKSDIKH